ncbi:outer membrane beta-barrel family protein [Mucilaginibacter sp. CAU 1740]|uniref:outer membrane beta-barrel family protein n=1 Tax=Mucilaginibacter sp. CAU 1740 TaxID=3140365 RepID=UPI00325A8FFE
MVTFRMMKVFLITVTTEYKPIKKLTFKLQHLNVSYLADRSMKKILCILILIFFCRARSLAQQNQVLTKIRGLVVNDHKEQVNYATVTLLHLPDSSIVKGSLSNGFGLYTFENLKPGDYIVKVNNPGYQMALSNPFKIDESLHSILLPNIVLQPNNHVLKVVEIKGSKPLIDYRSGMVIVNVENSVLAAGNSAFDILQRAPGVSVDKDNNISLQGGQGVSIMIDDKLTYLSAEQLISLLRSTDGSTVKSIEIITSPSAKYDAAGNTGIINIRLKHITLEGSNGSISFGLAKAAKFYDNASLSLNHKAGKVNLFGTFNYDDPITVDNIAVDRIISNSAGLNHFNGQTLQQANTTNTNYRLGADYETSAKNVLGLIVSGFNNTESQLTDTRTQIQQTETTIDSLVTSNSNAKYRYKNWGINLDDKLTIDTTGQELSADIDYVDYNTSRFTKYDNSFFLADGSEQHPEQLLTNSFPSRVKVRVGKVDYVKPLNKNEKLEAGFKYSDVKTDNDLQAQIFNNGGFINDTTQSNHFIYKEKITAAYVSLYKQMATTSLQLSLRSEYTQSSGNLIGRSIINRHYLDFFPNAYLSQTLDDKNEISLSYSRRIDRPAYDELNPFVYFLDPYTFRKGNAFLNPQYTNKFNLSYTYNKTINVSLGYSHTSNVITSIVVNEGNKSVAEDRNFSAYDNYRINLDVPYQITKWWSGNVDINGFYKKYRADSLNGNNIGTTKFAYQVKAYETFIWNGIKGELSGAYYSNTLRGVDQIRQYYFIDAGVSKSFDNKKLNLKLSLSDILKSNTLFVSTHLISNFSYFDRSDSRIARITATYNFGNSKNKSREHISGANEENERAGGS